jgi:hypothetical protein
MPDQAVVHERVLVEPVLVEVEQDGTWWPGTLTEWARWDERGWQGHCRWTTAPGSTYLTWVLAARLRPRSG